MPYPFDCITDFMFFETELEPSDVILVPGGSHPQLMERAAALFHQGMSPYILPSGGPTSHVETTEWEYLKTIGVSLGVPDQAILKEDRATDTFKNSSYSYEVLQSMGIIPSRVILVCKSYHARRALLTYQIDFPKETTFYVSPVTDKTGITKQNWYQDEKNIRIVMTELEKIGKYFCHHIPNWVNR